MADLKSVISESLPDNVTSASLPEAAVAQKTSQQVAEEVKEDVKSDSSTEAHVEATTPKAEQEVPFHLHPRWVERQRELEAAREHEKLLADQNRQLMAMVQKSQETQTPIIDPYAGMTPEEKVFWEKSRQIAREEAERVAKSYMGTVQQETQETKAAVTSMLYERFQQKHPDIQANSPEENLIAQKFRQGYTLDDAYEIVMGPVHRGKLEQELQLSRKTKEVKNIKDKEAANLESTTPQVKTTEKRSYKQQTEDFVDEWMKRGTA
jgi:hypothetical protein